MDEDKDGRDNEDDTHTRMMCMQGQHTHTHKDDAHARTTHMQGQHTCEGNYNLAEGEGHNDDEHHHHHQPLPLVSKENSQPKGPWTTQHPSPLL